MSCIEDGSILFESYLCQLGIFAKQAAEDKNDDAEIYYERQNCNRQRYSIEENRAPGKRSDQPHGAQQQQCKREKE
jgi:hypothetical protein